MKGIKRSIQPAFRLRLQGTQDGQERNAFEEFKRNWEMLIALQKEFGNPGVALRGFLRRLCVKLDFTPEFAAHRQEYCPPKGADMPEMPWKSTC
ncbi:hypothetical protein M378DRAFT_165688 [Amanita muscaria Koide BX008]|uniref:Uncharacterized protein n=1 Tax=Amanita muscaria (strain Koide BX008) TaxID=946122 RepID=A0A0C2T7B7_AMAMK|nr:hypothetical protein M378DRAFT_165688 [Amanita muscaria Koide BX008]